MESKALSDINSRQKSFVNKDFTKNIAWLNQSVDTLSAYTQKLQKGVEQANQNAIEQIQGIWADLFVLLAGGEPTGIEVGDVKYVLQGIGALLGINPDTPFPLNLVEAAWHLFETYIIPADQFTDVIFDAITAWAEDLGLTPEFIDSLTQLKTAIEGVTDSFDDFFNSLSELLSALGFMNFSELGDLLAAVLDLFDNLALEPLKPVIAALADLGIPFINALTAIVNTANTFLDPLSIIAGSQIASLGQNVVPTPSPNTTLWSVGGDSTNAWVFDATQSATGTPSTTNGSLTTLGTGVAKRVLTQKVFQCTSGQKFTIKGAMRWAGIPSATTGFSLIIVWYSDANEGSTTTFNIPGGHGASGGWSNSVNQTDVTVPINTNGFRIGARVDATVSTGQVWIDDISAQLQGSVAMGFVEGLTSALADLLPFDFFDSILGESANPANLLDYFLGLLDGSSPLNSFNLFNLIDPGNIPIIGTGQLADISPNLLTDAGFTNGSSLAGSTAFTHDATLGHSTPNGTARTTANGTTKDLLSNYIRVAVGDKFDLSTWVKRQSVTGTGTPIRMGVTAYQYNPSTDVYSAISQPDLVQQNVTTPTVDWTQLTSEYDVTDPAIHGIKFRLTVASTATAGTVWFDDCFAGKKGLVSQGLIDGLPDDLESIFTNLESVGADLLLKVSQGQFDELLTTLGGAFGSTIAAIEDRLADFLGTGSTLNGSNIGLGSIADTFLPGVKTIVDNLVTGLLNIGGSGFTHPDVFQALSANADAITGLAAKVTTLETIYTSGVSDGDDFERTSSSNLGSGWQVFYSSGSGVVATPNGHDASWVASGTGDREFVALRNTGQIHSATNNQRVLYALASAPTSASLLGFAPVYAFNDVWLRVSDDTTSLANITGIRIRYGSDGSVRIHRFLSGTGVELNSVPPGSIAVPGPGSILGGEAGIPGTARFFKALIGSNVPVQIPEVGSASMVGSAYTRWGFGGKVNGYIFVPILNQGQTRIGSMRQWTAMDQ